MSKADDLRDIAKMSYLKEMYPMTWWWFDDQYSTPSGDWSVVDIENERVYLIMMERMHKKILALANKVEQLESNEPS